MTLVNLWTFKAGAANETPFDAKKDIVDAAMDIINAAAFSIGDSMSTTKHQLEYLTSGNAKMVDRNNGSFEFSRLVDLPEIAAITAVADHLGTQFRSIMPRLDHKIRILTQPKLRRNIARKDAMISREIARSLQRFSSGDHAMFSALDHLLQREMNAAHKADRQPDYYSARIKDEVSPNNVAKGNSILAKPVIRFLDISLPVTRQVQHHCSVSRPSIPSKESPLISYRDGQEHSRSPRRASEAPLCLTQRICGRFAGVASTNGIRNHKDSCPILGRRH